MNYTYTALTTLKVGGNVVKTDEQVVLDEATGSALVEDGLVERASDTPVEVETTTVAKVARPAKKTGTKGRK